ncbi:hypothetical protein C4J98_2189 [Pseudomonas orientalis]|uniref:EamA family transporter n=1 Tax=Pseudomonas orientalis TaxID=76758 RepID=UPI000F56DC8C|nr:hypothetical protein [Pseudomonas orientalis]AZE83602.1 hypothetical protein C4J98_2189 [Pseudomonas orientalis]
MKTQQAPSATDFQAIVLSGLANLILGASSLYWKALGEVPPTTLVAYRVALSCILLAAVLLFFRRISQTKYITIKLIALHGIASLVIAINWTAFIGASINGYILESGIGYLLAPFISIALGALIYHEPLPPAKITSICVAFGAILTLIILSENLSHWTYLSIATTWGTYTYLKKSTPLNAVTGLFLETFFLSGCLTVAIWLFDYPVTWPGELSTCTTPLIWLTGVVSVTPLLMFSFATGKIPLSFTGFLQFILPLTLLTIGFFINGNSIPAFSLTLIISTAGLLVGLLAYDTVASHSPKK